MGEPGRITALLACVLFGLVSFGGADGSSWRQVTGPPALSLPSDHGAHPAFRTEWWYLTGLVHGEDGRRYGFQLTFFRQGLDPSEPQPGQSDLRARQAVAAHLAVVDISRGRFLHAGRLRRAAAGLAGFATSDLNVWVNDWWLRREAGDVLRAAAADRGADVGVELQLEPQTPLVTNGDDGYSRKGAAPGNASVYLSWPRLRVTGKLEIAGRRLVVQGEAWYDHEWGTSQLGVGVVGWDWFGLRLDDGRALMVYRLRRADGSPSPFSSGTLVEADGSTRHLGAEDFILEVRDRWESPHSGAHYPSRWRLLVPAAGIDVEVRPLVADCEIDARASTGTVYWEGPVAVDGSSVGEGYAELTGYASSLADRF